MADIIIDPKWIDFDFRTEGRPTGFNGIGSPKAMRRFKDDIELIPESLWKPETAKLKAEGGGCSQLVAAILNQSNEGSCVGNAETQQHQIMQAKTFGKHNVTLLSAISAYQLIGSSANSGASVDDALEKGRDVGIIPLDTPENRKLFGSIVMPPTGFRSQRPSGWQAIAAQFRFDEYYVIQSLAEMMTALLKQFPIVVGRQGHSICYCDPVYDGNDLYALYANSWDYDWGIAAGTMRGGFGLDSKRVMLQSADWCYCPRSIIIPDHLQAQFATAL